MKLGSAHIGAGHPVYIIAEMSANHGHDFERAVKLVRAAAEAGANAVKLQTYTADTLTIDSDREYFRIGGQGPWAGRRLYELYQEAHTPWAWQPKLKKIGDELGVEVFSTPFDATSVDFLENEVGVQAYKVASFEVVDIPLLRKIASTRKPVIMSTGMASLSEVDTAVRTLREGGAPDVALLRCVSAYPAAPEDMNLATIPHLARTFGCEAGLSDHSLSPAVAVAAVALGASVVEKHFTLSRADGGPDSGFSLEPDEFRQLVRMIRQAGAAVGRVTFGAGVADASSVVFRKSIFVVDDIRQGDTITAQNVRVIRPGHGLAPMFLDVVLGMRARKDIPRGTPLQWSSIG